MEGGGNGDLFNGYRLSVLQNEKLSPRENQIAVGRIPKHFLRKTKETRAGSYDMKGVVMGC